VFTKTVDAHESTPTTFYATIDEIFVLRQSTHAEITVCRGIDEVTVLLGSPLTSHGDVVTPINIGGAPLFHMLFSHLVTFSAGACFLCWVLG
jgi:hypothetical protein